MALVSMRQLLDHAAEHGYGIPAFNVNNLEQVQAIMEAAAETDSPVIMQASAGARKYAGEGFLKHLIQAAVESYPHIPVVMHQDHGQSPKVCQGAIDLGFSSVMMDGSLKEDGKTIADYDYNVDVTRKVVDVAHKLGVVVGYFCNKYAQNAQEAKENRDPIGRPGRPYPPAWGGAKRSNDGYAGGDPERRGLTLGARC